MTQILTRLRITDERRGLRKRHLDALGSAAFGEPTVPVKVILLRLLHIATQRPVLRAR
jgi:hypothetical protein